MGIAFRTSFTNNSFSGLGVGVLATYPQIGAQGGLHALLVYCAAGAVPFILFGALGPIIRRQMPEAFVLTEWVRYRYGPICALVISCCTVLTIFLFMVSELASLKSMVETLTTVKGGGLPVLIVEAVVVSIYTSMGGFYVSFLTDNLQVATFLVLLAVCIIATGCTVKIDKHLVGPSNLLKENKLGWKLVYILTVAIVTNDCFMSGFWLRTFAAKTNKDLYISCALTAFALFALCAVLGVSGLLAVWAGLLPSPDDPEFLDESNNAFYLLIHSLPAWVSGFVLVFCVMLSACTFDSLQSAIVSTISNDFFRNRVRIQWVRLFMMATLAPCIVVALIAQNVLDIYLIVDILSSCVVPVLFLGLSKYFWFVTGFDVILSLIGGIIGVFVYGTIYGHSASYGGSLLLMEDGLYNDDWGAFGAFVAAPVCCVIGCFVGVVVRGIFWAIYTKRFFAVFDKPTNGLHFHDPYDRNLFVLAKPWYEYIPFGENFWRKVDWVIFVQGTGDEADIDKGTFIPSRFLPKRFRKDEDHGDSSGSFSSAEKSGTTDNEKQGFFAKINKLRN